MTREEVVEMMNYCKEHKVTYKSRLEELNIPVWRFYDSKSRYAAEQSSEKFLCSYRICDLKLFLRKRISTLLIRILFLQNQQAMKTLKEKQN